MMKHRGLILALGLTALLGLSARESRAANMTLEVIYGGTTYITTGSATAVTANLTVLNGDLAGSGYTFSGLSGSSNNTTATSNAFVNDSGTLNFAPGGAGGTLTIIVSESGFTAPASGTGNSLSSSQGATYANTTASSSQSDVGNFNDGKGVNKSLPTVAPTLFGTTTMSQIGNATTSLPAYATPFTLTTTTTISLGASSSSTASDVFTSQTLISSNPVPEPASLIMMLTGMPLPLVVVGLLRRRRAAA
jgi:hypothetical protein